MDIVSINERKLEKLINHQASEFNDCNIHSLMRYAEALTTANPRNPFIHLAEGIVCAKYKNPRDHSYAQSVWHLTQFLNYHPKHEDAVLWRLDSATNLVSGTPHTKSLARIADEAVRSFPYNLCVLTTAYNALKDGVGDYKEAVKVGTRILSITPTNDKVRDEIRVLRGIVKDDEAVLRTSKIVYKSGRPKVLKLPGVKFDN